MIGVEEIVVDGAETEDKLSIFEGRFRLRGEEYKFRGIAYMSYGGPNINISIDSESSDKLASAGIVGEKLEELIVELQKRVMNGEFSVVGNIKIYRPPV